MARNLGPFPPRPMAIATLLTTDDFLPGTQTLLYSIKIKLSASSSTKASTKQTPSSSISSSSQVHNQRQLQERYNPELIVLITPNVSPAVRAALHPAFCTRLIQVDPIPIPSSSSSLTTTNITKKNDGSGGSHVQSWDVNCGYTKLHIFNLFLYDRILYIDSDCLVVKDVQHLLHLPPSTPHNNANDQKNDQHDSDSENTNGDITTLQQTTNQPQTQKQQPMRDPPGLIAAAPDLFPPDKFNAGVMVIAPARQTFRDMMDRIRTTVSYDGGDTGFLNAYYPNWYSGQGEGEGGVGGTDDSSRRRLAFGYNAQRFMYDCTYAKQPKYWDVGVIGGSGDTNGIVGGTKDGLYVIHYSSSSKPWENTNRSTSSSSSSKEFLTQSDATNVSKTIKSSALDQQWRKIYERSQKFAKNFEEEREWLRSLPASRKRAPSTSSTATAGRGSGGGGNKRVSAAGPGGPRDAHSSVSKRFKELRKDGVGVKEAMAMARGECGDIFNDNGDAGAQVAAMFGMKV